MDSEASTEDGMIDRNDIVDGYYWARLIIDGCNVMNPEPVQVLGSGVHVIDGRGVFDLDDVMFCERIYPPAWAASEYHAPDTDAA